MKLTIEIDSTQVDDFITEVTTGVDVFINTYCGYWLRGIERDATGWLVFDCEGEHEQNDDRAIQRWTANRKLPKGYYRLDRDMAIKAWTEGAKKYGIEWYGKYGSETVDYAIQMAIFGKVVYG